jgi:hypothetical protein
VSGARRFFQEQKLGKERKKEALRKSAKGRKEGIRRGREGTRKRRRKE